MTIADWTTTIFTYRYKVRIEDCKGFKGGDILNGEYRIKGEGERRFRIKDFKVVECRKISIWFRIRPIAHAISEKENMESMIER